MPQRTFVGFIICLMLTSLSGGLADDSISVDVGPGGPGRYRQGHWGLLKGEFANKSDDDKEVLAVVVPAHSGGLQYGRRVTIPAKTKRECQWPVLLSDHDTENFDFEFLVFEDPEGKGPIKRIRGEQVARSFHGVNSKNRVGSSVGYRGLLLSNDETPRDLDFVEELADTLRKETGNERMALVFESKHIDGYPESLECLEQLLITSRTLHRSPAACDAVRVWTQRGGKTWLFADQTGMDTIRALLGDAFPITKIDETSSNVMKLEIDPAEPAGQSPVREVLREFDEPVRLMRIIAETGRVIWTVDGWPAVIELPFGNGTVVVTTVSPEVFLEVEGNIRTVPCAGQIGTLLFEPQRVVSRIDDDRLGAAAAGFIGYKVPSRQFAASVMLGFATLLIICGTVLLRRGQGMGLLWGVPCLACLCATPAVWVGHQTRSVAPETAIQQQVIQSVDGQTTQAADGLASVYLPKPSSLTVKMTDFSLLTPRNIATESNERRMVWTDRGESEWQNLSQAAGIRNYRIRALRRLDRPGSVTATFNSEGLTGRLPSGSDPSDMILASLSPERMAVRIQPDGTFLATPDDVLASTEFVTGTFLTDVQKQHASIYEGLFSMEHQDTAYPDKLSLLYFTQLKKPSITVGGQAMQQNGAALVSQTVVLQPPPPNTEFTIPPVMLPYQAVFDAQGGMSGVYSNSKRTWVSQARASTTFLEVSLPDVCQPFKATGGTLSIRINAGSRPVKVGVGSRDAPTHVRTLDSPAGLFTIDVPAEQLNPAAANGKLYIELDIGAPNLDDANDIAVAGREDNWRLGRIMLTLHGVRVP
ncbi:MAG: hypothetical protein P8J37_24945 [Fuerstiella sp.]|nr:hypothetical protein [Fuerstiella sp.]